MKLFKWQPGRQHGTEYQKMLISQFKIWKWGFDIYLLKYAPNTLLDWHTDPVKDGKHWRRNYRLWGWATFCIKKEGKIYCGMTTSVGWFRPDIEEHMLQVHDKKCIKLSFGFVKFN